MANLVAEKWADMVELVEQNFRILFEKALEWPVPTNEGPHKLDEYKTRKTQMLNSMLFYTTRISLDGVRVKMTDDAEDRVSRTVQKVETLKQELLKHQKGDNPLEFETFCNNFMLGDLCCPTPLVLFLKMAVDSEHHTSNIQEIKTLLGELKLEKFAGYRGYYYPGVPACILGCQSSDGNLKPLITSTKDRFDGVRALENASDDLWSGQLQRLERLCLQDNKKHINHLKDLSNKFVTKVRKTGAQSGQDVEIQHPLLVAFLEQQSKDETQKRFALTGVGETLATWKPNGDYLESCLLDYYRFFVNRPQDNQTPSRKVWAPACCAEWFFFIEKASVATTLETKPLLESLKFTDEQGRHVQQGRAMQSQETAPQGQAAQQERSSQKGPPTQQRARRKPGQRNEKGAWRGRGGSSRGQVSGGQASGGQASGGQASGG